MGTFGEVKEGQETVPRLPQKAHLEKLVAQPRGTAHTMASPHRLSGPLSWEPDSQLLLKRGISPAW